MSHFLDWRDYTRQAHIKQLIETKGLEYVRQQFLKESNKALWDDPLMLTEQRAVGQSLSNNNSAAMGNSPSIIGDTAEVSRFTWSAGITNNVTSSNGQGLNGYYFDIVAYNGAVDYSYHHVDSTKRFRFLIVSASSNYTYSNTSGLAGLITASYTQRTETRNITGSILNKFKQAIANQGANAVVAGFTNTIAPTTLFTSTLAAGSGSLTVTHQNEGGVPDITTNLLSVTASVSVVTQGLDKYYNSTNWYDGARKFDGSNQPYQTLIRRG
jgi:hypothetical protein